MKNLLPILAAACLFGTLTILNGCANPVVSRVADTYATQNPAKFQPPPAAVEVRSKPKGDYAEIVNSKKFSLTVRNAEIDSVLLMLSRESGVPIIAERGITGLVSVALDKKQLGEALYAVIKPLGYTAVVDNGVIVVGRPKLESRTFRINYIKDKRETRSNTNVSVFGSGSNESTSSGYTSNTSNTGNVNVTTSGVADLWGSVEGALEMMVFGSIGGGRRDSSGFVRGEGARKLDSVLKITESQKNTRGHNNQLSLNSYKLQGSTEFKTETAAAAPTDELRPDDEITTRLAEERLKQLVVNEIGGIVVVTDYAENLDKIALFLNDLELAIKRQVFIQAHIIEVTLRDAFALGIDWNVIAGNLNISQGLAPLIGSNVFNISASGEHFGAMMDAMKEQGQVKMLSSPKVIAMNNQKAIIKLTTKEVSWTTHTTPGQNNSNPVTDTVAQIDEVGIFLDVTPQIDETGRITMQVHPSVSEVKRYSVSPDGKSNRPVIDIREIDTMVDTKSGDTIVIAGLIVDKLHETKRSVPLLGDIPYLGTLFSYNEQNREKTELVIFLTPFFLNAATIEDIRKAHEKRLRDYGDTYHLINNLGSLATERSGE